MDIVARQALRLKKACSKSNAEWSELSAAVTELADAVEALNAEAHAEAVADHLLPLASELDELLRNIRSKLVCDVCEQLGRIVKTTRLAFTPLANALLDALASTAKASSVAIRTPGFQLFSDVSEYAQYDLQTVGRVFRSSPQERVKTLLIGQMQIVLTYWSKRDIEPFYDEMLEMMRRGLRDPSTHVRTASRQTFCSFSDIWKERLNDLADVPTPPARDLLIREKPHAAITKAIREKFGLGSPKDGRAEAIRQRRAAARRQGEGDGSIFVEVTDSPRRVIQQQPAQEVPRRAASPGRSGAVRGSSPSRRTRGASPSARGPSPPAALRASPRRARAASPAQAQRDSAAGARVTSHERVGRSSSIDENGRSSVSPPTRGRNSELDRFLNMSMLNATADSATSAQAPDEKAFRGQQRSQKRVSIVEPSQTINQPAPSAYTQFMNSHKPNGESNMASVPPDPTTPLLPTSAYAQFLQSHKPNRVSTQNLAPTSDPSHRSKSALAQFMEALPPNGQGPPLSEPAPSSTYGDTQRETSNQPTRLASFDVSNASASRYAAQALKFVAHDQSRQDENHRLPSDATQHRSSLKQPSTISAADDTSFEADAFLDRPIPSSSPAPEPRASANITQRERRRTIEGDAARHNGETESKLRQFRTHSSHAKVPPVPDSSFKSIVNQEEPPSESIAQLLHRDNMTSRRAESNVLSKTPLPISNERESRHDGEPEENGDKENNSKANILKEARDETTEPDAIASLGAIRASLKACREAPSNTITALQSRPDPLVEEERSDSTQKIEPPTKFNPPVAHNRQPLGPISSDVNAVLSRPEAQKARGQATRPPKPLFHVVPPSRVQAANEEVTSRQVAPEPSPDFVREAAPFKFVSPISPAQAPTRKSHHQDQQRGLGQNSSQIQSRVPIPVEGKTAPMSSGQPSVIHRPHPPQAALLHEQALRAPTREQPRPVFPAQESKPEHCAEENQRRLPFSLNHGLPPHSAPANSHQQPHHDEQFEVNQPKESPRSNSETATSRRQPVVTPKPKRIQSGVASKMVISFLLVLGAIFGISGLIQAATKVRDAYEYHNALLHRINQFETNIVESFESVRKMDEKYAVWSEYVRELTEQDESNALHQLESIQHEVEKWQIEMKNDLLAFKRSLSGDVIDSALAPLREPNSTADAEKQSTT